MITREQYFTDPNTGIRKATLPEHEDAAKDLLKKVNGLLDALHWPFQTDPDTGTSISGKKGGVGGGGFRASTEEGAPKSKHKIAHAVDVYDPGNALDGRLTNEVLEEHGLYREHPDATPGWCHLQDLPPKSRRRTFYP